MGNSSGWKRPRRNCGTYYLSATYAVAENSHYVLASESVWKEDAPSVRVRVRVTASKEFSVLLSQVGSVISEVEVNDRVLVDDAAELLVTLEPLS